MNLVLSYCTTRQFSRGFIPLAAFTVGDIIAHNDDDRPVRLNRPPSPDVTVLLDIGAPVATFTSTRSSCAEARFLNFLTLG